MSRKQYERLPLQDMALASSTLKAYDKQLQNFLTHSRLSLHQLHDLSPRRLDRALAEFVQHSYDCSRPFTYASHALHAVVLQRPELKHDALYQARACLKGWERVKKSHSHPPLTWELTIVLACTMARAGYHSPALAMLVGFDCYLRVSELTGLRRRDIVMPNDARMGRAHSHMAVILPKTKTGLNQSVSLQRHDVALLLASWVRAMPGERDTLVFDFTPQWFGRLIRNCCVQLGVGHISYVPHSLRHGGATADFLARGDVEYVHFRGRWKSIESVRTYIQTARALLAAQQVPAHLNTLGILLGDEIVAVLEHGRRSIPEVVPRKRAKRVTFRL